MNDGRNSKVRVFHGVLAVMFSLLISFFISPPFHLMLSKENDGLKYLKPDECLTQIINVGQTRLLFLVFAGLIAIVLFAVFGTMGTSTYYAQMYKVTPRIKIPMPGGQNQHGSSWWLTDHEYDEEFSKNIVDLKEPQLQGLMKSGYDDLPRKMQKGRGNQYIENALIAKGIYKKSELNIHPFKSGGLVVGYKKIGSKKEAWSYVNSDTHTIVIGATRCGKTRTLVIQSIINLALAGESIFMSDPKGEISQYTQRFLEKLGYKVIILDYKNMSKSMSYNLLQPVIDSCKKGDINRAIQQSTDIANTLVGEKSDNGEPLWHNGQLAVIAACIIGVVYDNMDNPKNQNIAYVYEFITRMCAQRKAKPLLLQEYLEAVGEDHPANLKLAQANVAPEKTKGSFYTSAATTLSIWTDRELYHLIKRSDFVLEDIGKEKTAVFVVLPDHKTTFHPVAALMVSQVYEALVEYSDLKLKTGRLPNRVNFVLDEFGNFAAINDMAAKLTVAGGRGMRFNFFLQDFHQLEKKYDQHTAATIKSNCETWVYLQTDDQDTQKTLEHRLGTYTTTSYSKSAQSNNKESHSMNLIERSLLKTAEIKRITRPYQLVMGKSGSKVVYSPDLSKWSVNTMLGLGDEEHNKEVRRIREEQRETRPDISDKPDYVGIWLSDEFADFKLHKMQEKTQSIIEI